MLCNLVVVALIIVQIFVCVNKILDFELKVALQSPISSHRVSIFARELFTEFLLNTVIIITFIFCLD